MSTGYAIFRRERSSGADDAPDITVVQVLWHEEQAADMVSRLNALGSGPPTYFWQETWIAHRPETEAGGRLTPTDRESLELARSHGAIDTERPLAAFFSLIFDLPGALAACDELTGSGFPDVGAVEEATDDECWHVYAHGRRLTLDEESIVELRAEMEDLAERHGGTFDRWDVSGGPGLRWAKPGELPV
jgi:Regulator of ribonuclease activity B